MPPLPEASLLRAKGRWGCACSVSGHRALLLSGLCRGRAHHPLPRTRLCPETLLRAFSPSPAPRQWVPSGCRCDTWGFLVPRCSASPMTLPLCVRSLPTSFSDLVSDATPLPLTHTPGSDTLVTVCPGPHIQLWPSPPISRIVTLNVTSQPGQAPRLQLCLCSGLQDISLEGTQDRWVLLDILSPSVAL